MHADPAESAGDAVSGKGARDDRVSMPPLEQRAARLEHGAAEQLEQHRSRSDSGRNDQASRAYVLESVAPCRISDGF